MTPQFSLAATIDGLIDMMVDAPIGFCVRRPDWSLVTANAEYARIVGVSLAHLLGTQLITDRVGATAGPFKAEALDYVCKVCDAAGPATNDCPPDHFVNTRRVVRYEHGDGTVIAARVYAQWLTLDGGEPMIGVFAVDMTSEMDALRSAEWAAAHDQLTGLPNRAAFDAELSTAFAESRDLTVMFIDLDRFKSVNDSLGHRAGDDLLVVVANRIRVELRAGDMLARFGGDEFCVLLRGSDRDFERVIAERIIATVSRPISLGQHTVAISASIGIATPQPKDTEVDLLRYADVAMYQAKAGGRNAAVVFGAEQRAALVTRLDDEARFTRAVLAGDIEVYYQPEVDVLTGRVLGAEALCRWRHPERGLISAGEWIMMAEETGLVLPLGAAVLRSATEQAATWLSLMTDPGGFHVRVNLSVKQLALGERLVGEVEAALARSGLDPWRLCLEVTEAGMADAAATEVLTRLRSLGCTVAIDDFGTGFSSMSRLKALPADVLKIDRSFVHGLPAAMDTSIITAIVNLAQGVGMDVVAEGVETVAQLDLLRTVGVRRCQGFHFSQPVSAWEFTRRLASSEWAGTGSTLIAA